MIDSPFGPTFERKRSNKYVRMAAALDHQKRWYK